MNILIPHTWLLDHLETDADPATIQELVTLSGPSIERIYDREGESVYDIEVTTNRVDSMSVRGIAREAAVILEQAGKEARLKTLTPAPNTSVVGTPSALPEIDNDQRWCKRTMCVVLQNVAHTPTPEWMAKRLRQTNQNIHDSCIDITNYVTHELGHPCHAFDYNKIMQMGGAIIIKEATAGKSFTTLDGETYETKGGEIVFENKGGDIIDLPAIKGTANTAVDDNTTAILLWIESIDPKKVRTASMNHAIRTVAAQLNEKNVDPYLAEPTLMRAIALYQELCTATVASEIYDDFSEHPVSSSVTVPLSAISTYIGIELPVEQITTILTALECIVELSGDTITVTPPTFRPDIQISVDVIEEIARIYGYHKLPSVLMSSSIPTTRQPGVHIALEEQVKRFLAARGAQELYTYSMVSEKLALADGFSLEQHLKLSNPLTDDRVYLRRSLTPSLIEGLHLMQQRKRVVFELANVYHPQEKALPQEVLRLTIVSGGEYRALRGHVAALLTSLFIPKLVVNAAEYGAPEATLSCHTVDGHELQLGTVSHHPGGVVSFDFDWSALVAASSTHPAYHPLPKAESLTEDLTFTLPERTSIGQLITSMEKASPLLTITLGEQYENNYTFHCTYLDPETSLSSQDVAPLRAAVVSLAKESAGAVLVGTLQE